MNERTTVADCLADRAAAFLSAFPAFLAALLLLGLAAAPALAQKVEKAAACPPGENLLETLAPDARRAAETEAAATPNGEGRLFEITREGLAPSHLFGTMHLSDPRVVELPPAAEAAFEAADRLIVETLDVADETQMAAALLTRPDLTVLPKGTELSDLIPEERRPALEAAFEANGMPVDAIRTLQPWFVTAALIMPACELERQAQGAEVLDLALLSRAESRGQKVSGLESAVEQMEALASLPLDLQAENLVATLDLLDRLPDIFETMIDLYLGGQVALIMPAIESLAPSGSDAAASVAVYAAFEERIVTKRNITMAERLAPMLAEGGAFVAIGALHLPGEKGLVELLRDQGYAVERAD